MSKHESPMVLRWWEQSSLTGTLCEEWPIVPKSPTTERRRVDALVVVGGSGKRVVPWQDVTSIRDADVVIVQAKSTVLNMPLCGQAIGSYLLALDHAPRSVACVTLCAADDPELRIEAGRRGVDVVVDPLAKVHKFEYPPDLPRVRQWANGRGGTLLERPVLSRTPLKLAHAVWTDLSGVARLEDAAAGSVTVLTAPAPGGPKSGKRFGMYAIGVAALSRDLLATRGFRDVRSVILAEAVDARMESLATNFGVEVQRFAGIPESRSAAQGHT